MQVLSVQKNDSLIGKVSSLRDVLSSVVAMIAPFGGL